MTDQYIDNAAAQVYGPALCANLQRLLGRELADLPAPLQETLRYVIVRQSESDGLISTALGAARARVSSLSAAAEAKAPVLVDARKAMRSLWKLLDARRESGQWTGDLTLFFPDGLGGIPKFGRTLLPAMRATLAALRADAAVPERAEQLRRLTRAEQSLAAHVGTTQDAHHEARGVLSEQAAEKLAWLVTYRGNALLVEGALTHAGRLDLLTTTVPHLAVRDGSAKPAAPVEPAPIG